jgi:5-methylcytosine-specific restriction endonuclease McrA
VKFYELSHLADPTLELELATSTVRLSKDVASHLARIAEFDARKLYAPAGCSSMHDYCKERLGMNKDVASKRIQAARVARDFPAIFEAVADGRLTYSAVCLLAPCLATGTAESLIAAAAGKSSAEVRQFLREQFPKPEVFTWTETPVGQPVPRQADGVAGAALGAGEHDPDHAHLHVRAHVEALSAQLFGVQFPLNKEEYDLMQRSRELRPAADEKEVFVRALRAHVAQMEKRKIGAKPSRPPRPTRSARLVPAHIRHAVWERDQGQCTFVSEDGHRCTARTHLQFDHVVPAAQGGEATVSNIRLLCRTHNQYEAERVLGAEFMRNKREAAAEARVKVSAEKKAIGELDRDIIAGLRNLGYNAGTARRAAETCRDMVGATLEERFRAALAWLRPRGTYVARAGAA